MFIIITINMVLILILLVSIIFLNKKNAKSIMDYTHIISYLVISIFPILFTVINSIINFIYKPKMIFWLIGITPLIIPIIYIIIKEKRLNDNRNLYKKYDKKIKEELIREFTEIDKDILSNQVKNIIRKDRKNIYCKTIITINEKKSDLEIVELKKKIEKKVEEVFCEIEFNIFIKMKEKKRR